MNVESELKDHKKKNEILTREKEGLEAENRDLKLKISELESQIKFYSK